MNLILTVRDVKQGHTHIHFYENITRLRHVTPLAKFIKANNRSEFHLLCWKQIKWQIQITVSISTLGFNSISVLYDCNISIAISISIPIRSRTPNQSYLIVMLCMIKIPWLDRNAPFDRQCSMTVKVQIFPYRGACIIHNFLAVHFKWCGPFLMYLHLVPWPLLSISRYNKTSNKVHFGDYSMQCCSLICLISHCSS